MRLSPDSMILWSWGGLHLNGTILFTWLVMAGLSLGSWLLTRPLSQRAPRTRGQQLPVIIIAQILVQIEDVTRQEPRRFLPFLGTIFLFIATSNLLSVVPWFEPPTGSLSTTTALALLVMIAVPVYGIADGGAAAYLRNYLSPTPLMLPFNIIGELSRTMALAVRLFGNVMSGAMIGGILLILTPLFFPVVMQLFGLLTGLVQAYIFTILAAIFIAAGLKSHDPTGPVQPENRTS